MINLIICNYFRKFDYISSISRYLNYLTMYSYTYSITRHCELHTTISSATPLTKKSQIMAFYDGVITSEDRARIITAFNDGELADVFNYILNGLVNRDPTLPECKYYEIMGDCQFYEGLEDMGNNSYEVYLGS